MIIDRYLVGEVSRPFLVVSFVLLAIFTTFGLARFLVDANAGLLKLTEVVQLTALKALISLEVLLPLSFYLGVIIGLGRLHSDSEIYAMRASGISEKRTLKPIMLLALALAVLIGGFSLLVRPWAYVQSHRIRNQAASDSEVERIKSAQFYIFNDQECTVYIQQISADGTKLQGVFIRTRKGNDLQVVTALSGEVDDLVRPSFHRLKLQNARVYNGAEGGPNLLGRFGTFVLWLPVQNPKPAKYNPESTSTPALRKSTTPLDIAEYQWRLSTPVSTLLLALLAMPLSRSRPRAGRYARMLLALVVYALYFSLLDISRSWVQQAESAYIWWVPGLLGLFVLAFYLPWKKFFGAKKAAQNA